MPDAVVARFREIFPGAGTALPETQQQGGGCLEATSQRRSSPVAARAAIMVAPKSWESITTDF